MIDYLDERAVSDVLDYPAVIDCMHQALVEHSGGQSVQVAREWLALEDKSRYFAAMPASAGDALGCKLVSFFPGQRTRGAPSVNALVILFDARDGRPCALIDAVTLTAMRTAGVSAAVARALAPASASVLAILGSGREAESHLAALSCVRSFSEVRVWSRTRQHAEAFGARHNARPMDAQAAVQGADVIVAATATHTAILEGAWLKPGALVISIGAPMPTWRELDDATMSYPVVVESRAAALAESGDVILSGIRPYAEAGEILRGSVTIPTGSTVVFKSVGMAVEDVRAADLAYREWRRRRGTDWP